VTRRRARLVGWAIGLASFLLLGAFPRLRGAVDAIEAPPPPLTTGMLLVARPGGRTALTDRTVILVVDRVRPGTFGLVLDRPPPGLGPRLPYWGGPIERGNVAALVPGPAAFLPESDRVTWHVFVVGGGGLAIAGAGVRRFRGFAGWWPGQLEKEIARLEQVMYEHARNLEFEQAAAIRDEINKIRDLAYGPGVEEAAS